MRMRRAEIDKVLKWRELRATVQSLEAQLEATQREMQKARAVLVAHRWAAAPRMTAAERQLWIDNEIDLFHPELQADPEARSWVADMIERTLDEQDRQAPDGAVLFDLWMPFVVQSVTMFRDVASRRKRRRKAGPIPGPIPPGSVTRARVSRRNAKPRAA
jgi:hypothetical protein